MIVKCNIIKKNVKLNVFTVKLFGWPEANEKKNAKLLAFEHTFYVIVAEKTLPFATLCLHSVLFLARTYLLDDYFCDNDCHLIWCLHEMNF